MRCGEAYQLMQSWKLFMYWIPLVLTKQPFITNFAVLVWLQGLGKHVYQKRYDKKERQSKELQRFYP